MTEEPKTDIGTNVEATDIGAVADAPVMLSVELARFTLSVAELAAVRVGEILTAGARIGDQVVVRAGDHVIAEGELVDVEGEVGVRITTLAT